MCVFENYIKYTEHNTTLLFFISMPQPCSRAHQSTEDRQFDRFYYIAFIEHNNI